MMARLGKKELKIKKNCVRFEFSSFGFDGKDDLAAEEVWNCDCGNGLKPILLWEPLCLVGQATSIDGTRLPHTDIEDIFYFRFRDENLHDPIHEELYYTASSGLMYKYNAADKTVTELLYFKKPTIGLSVFNREDKHAAVFVSESVSRYEQDGKLYDLWLSGNTAACAYNGRLFWGVQKGRILYSEPDTPWKCDRVDEEKAYICLSLDYGEIVGLVAWKKYVYVFLEYGLVRLTPAGEARDFCVEDMRYSGGRIFTNSAALCGERIFFLTENGLCAFDGESTKPIGDGLYIRPCIEGQICRTAIYDGRYLLRYMDEVQGDVTVIASDSENPRVCFVTSLLGMRNSGSMVVFGNKEGDELYLKKLSGDGVLHGKTFFKSRKTDFGVAGRKTLKKLYLRGFGAVLVRVYNGNRVFKKKVTLAEEGESVGNAEICVYERGKEFRFEFDFYGRARIDRLGADVAFDG